MIKIDFDPSRKKLIQFGWVGLLGFTAIGFIVGLKAGSFEENGSLTIPLVLWGLALLSPALSLVCPKALLPLYLCLSVIAIPIGFVLSYIILMFIFYFLITPICLFFRLLNRDELRIRHGNSNRKSNWVSSAKEKELKSYFRQY